MARKEKKSYLIIGNSAGGIAAAEAIRKADKTGAITILSDEPWPGYSRPLISHNLSEGKSIDKMLFRPAEFYDTCGIQLLLNNKAVSIDIIGKTVELANGKSIAWHKLLLATGGQPIIPKIEGTGLEGVFTFTTRDDAKAIDAFINLHAERKVKAVVIGGGLIGVSVTEALIKRNVEVTIVEMQQNILMSILDTETAAVEEETIRRSGVEIITGFTVNTISSDPPGKVSGVILNDGRSLPCDIVILAVGVQPRIKLARDAGIETNRGIIVDRHMATSAPDVFACGDAAEAYDFLRHENRVNPIWPAAYSGGKVAGANMAGVPAEFQGDTSMNAMKYFGLHILSAGIVVPPDESYEVLSRRENGSYQKIVIQDGLIKGFVFMNEIERAGVVYNLMKDEVNVDDFKQVLVAGDFSLTGLPETIWQPLLTSVCIEPALAESAAGQKK
ncbi:MAG: FAD-dependent oxidoreductase [Dehalococcoidia bacterium]